LTAKIADSRGRVTLGPRFANQTVIVEEVGPTEVRIMIVAVVPEREMWLRRHPAARKSVLRGLAQARSGKISRARPSLDQNATLAERSGN
jgi:hypothetical protein